MEYRFLGKTGLKVSALSFGNCLNSEHPDDQQRTNELVKLAYDSGINFFDTAEFYGFGEAEKQYGIAFKALGVPRENIVVSTKIFWGDKNFGVNRVGLSRKHIMEGMKQSLKNLQLDYVDLVFCHRFDHLTPLEETCRAFDQLIKSGLVHYWGTSEWSAANIFEARAICSQFNLAMPVMDQVQYNMFVREKMEKDYIRLFDLYGMGTTVWSPLYGGLLTGKYNTGKIPDGTRFQTWADNSFLKNVWEVNFGEGKSEKTQKKLQEIGKIAESLGMSQAELAMAWVLCNKDVSTAITGARSAQHLLDSCKAVQSYKKLTPEVLSKIESILDNRPTTETDFYSFTPMNPRR